MTQLLKQVSAQEEAKVDSYNNKPNNKNGIKTKQLSRQGSLISKNSSKKRGQSLQKSNYKESGQFEITSGGESPIIYSNCKTNINMAQPKPQQKCNLVAHVSKSMVDTQLYKDPATQSRRRMSVNSDDDKHSKYVGIKKKLGFSTSGDSLINSE